MDWENDGMGREYLLKKMELAGEEIDDDVMDRFFEEIELDFEAERE